MISTKTVLRFFRLRTPCTLASSPQMGDAIAQGASQCKAVSNAEQRLACYDNLFGHPANESTATTSGTTSADKPDASSPVARTASLDQCPDFGDPGTTPHCISQQQFCVAYSSLPFDLASMQNARRFTDPRDLVAVVEGVVSAVSTGGSTLRSMGPEAANALASNIIAWYAKNGSSIDAAARMRRVPVALDPAEIRIYCIKEGTLDFLDSVP